MVYKINCWYGTDYDFRQVRFVAAKSEQDAIEKFIKEQKRLKKAGFEPLNYDEYSITVEIDNIIY